MNPYVVDAAALTAYGVVVAAVLAASAAVAAAFLAFGGTALSNRTARRNYALQARIAQQIKHADFRQAWIDELRNAMVEFQRLAVEKKPAEGSEAFGNALAILLRMNPRDPNYDALLDKIAQLMKDKEELSRETWLETHADFVSLCQKILKTEWDVLKRDLNDLSYPAPQPARQRPSFGRNGRRGSPRPRRPIS